MRLILVVGLFTSIAAAQRYVAVAIDTSGSMNDNDRVRYTIQLSKILGDLVAPNDELAVYRMPEGEFTSATPDRSLRIRLDPARRDAFKSALEAIPYSTGTYFLTPVRTAIADVGTERGRARLLLLITDATAYSCCDREVDDELRRYQQTGAVVAAIGVGSAADMSRYRGLDVVRGTRNPVEMVQAVAEIYQKFLGGRNVQTGQARGNVAFRVDPFVREAFLVVAADGPMPPPVIARNSPGAASADTNYRGGGETGESSSLPLLGRLTGRGKVRAYRIVRLERPAAGDWSVELPGLADQAGWMLIQDFALQLRMVSQGAVPSGVPTPLEVEVIDETTGKRITDSKLLRDLTVDVNIGGQNVRLRDDGAGGDRTAGDGVFTAVATFAAPGDHQVTGHLSSANIDRNFAFSVKVTAADGVVLTPSSMQAEVNQPVELKANYKPNPGSTVRAPDSIVAEVGGDRVELRPVAGQPGAYAANWTPAKTGSFDVAYTSAGGARTAPATSQLKVLGYFNWPNPATIRLGPVKSGGTAEAILDFSGAKIGGDVEFDVSTDLDLKRANLELDESGWRRLGLASQRMTISETGPRQFQLRLTAGECPEACRFTTPHAMFLSIAGAQGTRKFRVPLSIEVIPDAWWYCWRYEIATLIAAVLATFIALGIILPSRFRRGTGVQLNCEPDLENGVFYRFRVLPGVHIGFYRDSHAYVTSDHRGWGKRRGAIARLRAHKRLVLIRPENGTTIYRQTAAGDWEPLPGDEIPVQSGVTYRNDAENVYFDLRTR
jgi:hypothetical protein